MIGTIDIRGGLTVSRWLLTEQVWPKDISLLESLGIRTLSSLEPIFAYSESLLIE